MLNSKGEYIRKSQLATELKSVWTDGGGLKWKLATIHQALRFAWQRAFYGYDHGAVWDLYDSFARTYSAVLREWAETLMTHPRDVPAEEWKEILNKMADALERTHNNDWDGRDAREAARDEFMALFHKWSFDLWD